jgi:hypothetical protein
MLTLSKTVTRYAGSIPVRITLYRAFLSTGSRTHPWLHAITRYAGSCRVTINLSHTEFVARPFPYYELTAN